MEVTPEKIKEKEKSFEEQLKKAYESFRELQNLRCKTCNKKEDCSEQSYEIELHSQLLMETYVFTLAEMTKRTSLSHFVCDATLIFEVISSRLYKYIRREILDELRKNGSRIENRPAYIG